MKALLIIDMQKVSFTAETPRYDTIGTVSRINQLSAVHRKLNDLVVFIQHDGKKQNFCIPGTTEWELLDTIETSPEDHLVSKTANSSFYHSKLDGLLKDHGVKEIIITGCATDFCVEATIHSALTLDYDMTIIADGHTTANRPNLTSKQVIDHYNWVWADMTPTQGKIIVIPFQTHLENSI